MIVREIVKEPFKVMSTFDWFNDSKDTISWLKGCGHLALAEQVAAGYEAWQQENLKQTLLAIHKVNQINQ